MSEIRIIFSKYVDSAERIRYIEGAGPSDADKPTENIASGSFIIESDTGMVTMFDEDTEEWNPMFSIKDAE